MQCTYAFSYELEQTATDRAVGVYLNNNNNNKKPTVMTNIKIENQHTKH